MARLSAFVCAHNEAERLPACLERLRFADEIVVLLDRCTDASAEIARTMADRVVCGAFPLEGQRRAAAQDACTGDWVLEIDADEGVTPALAREIRGLLASDPAADWFLIPVDNHIGTHLVRHGWGGSFGTSAVGRLYRRGAKTWQDQRVHPTARLAGRQGPTLGHALQHQLDSDISDMLVRLDRYTRLRAEDLRESRTPLPSLASDSFRGLRRFLKCYLSRRGYREGGWGFLIALMAALYPILSNLRARLEAGDGAPHPVPERQSRPASAARAALVQRPIGAMLRPGTGAAPTGTGGTGGA